jgi:hypothetical protein
MSVLVRFSIERVFMAFTVRSSSGSLIVVPNKPTATVSTVSGGLTDEFFEALDAGRYVTCPVCWLVNLKDVSHVC